MKLKKWLSAIFAVVMVMSLLPAAALAAEGTGDEVSSEQPTSSVTEDEESTTPSSEVKTEGEGDELEGQGTVDTKSTEPTETTEEPVLPEETVNVLSDVPTSNEPSNTPKTSSVVEIDSNEDLVNAILHQAEGQTWMFTAAGIYDAANASSGGTYSTDQGSFALPIHVNDLTITKADGVGNVTLTSSYRPNSGNWTDQNFITIFSSGVTIENIDLKANTSDYYGTCNKVIELSGNAKDFTLRSVNILPLDDGEGRSFGGSIFFSVSDIGTTTIDDVTMDAWISASNVNTGKISVSNLTQDFSNSSYAGYSSESAGYAWNPGINAADSVLDINSFTIIVDGDANLNEQVFNSKLKAGTTVQLSGDVTIDSMLNINTDDITLDLNSHQITASNALGQDETENSNRQLINVTANNVTIENGKLVAGSNTRNVLNIWESDDVAISNLTIDHTNARDGAPVMVNGSNVTVNGKLNLETGEHSWYGMNVDCKNGDSSLSFAEGSSVNFSGTTAYAAFGNQGIVVENSDSSNNNTVTVDLGQATVTSNMDSFYAVVTASGVTNTITPPADDTLYKVADGTYVLEDDIAAFVGNDPYLSLQDAIDAAAQGDGVVDLYNDIDGVTVNVPAGADITVNGNGHTLTLAAGATGVFNGVASDNTEGLQSDTSLTVNNVNFKGASDSQNGHAVITGLNASGVNVTLSGCTFENLHDAVYCNAVTDPDAEANTISIADSTFTNVAYIYGVDDGATAGARTDAHSVTLENVSGAEESETFAVASVDGVGYTSLADAVAAAGKDDTVTLLKDASLDEMLSIATDGITLDLNGKTITASENFTSNWSNGNDSHLVQVLDATGVTIKNGTIETTAKNKHAVNIYGAEVTLEGLTVDHTNASTGAPVVIGGSDVTLSGKITVISGENSWYGINLDSRDINGIVTDSSLTVSKDAVLTFDGKQPIGIYVENTCAAEDGKVSLSFEENVTIASDIPKFVAVVYAKDLENATVDGADNAGLETDENGNLIIHEHAFGTEWVSDAAGHWHVCDCGEISDYAAHTFKWVIDKDATATEAGSKHEVCTVCGYEKAAVEIPATGTPTDPTDPTDPGDNNNPSGGDNTNTGDNSNTGSNTNTGSNNNTGSNANNSPKTSDNSMITVAVVVLVVACLGVALLLVYNGKIKSAYHGKRNADR